MKKLITTICFALTIALLHAQPPCDTGFTEILIVIQTDQYGYETSWDVVGSDGTIHAEVDPNTYANNTNYATQVCVPDGDCVTFTIYDSFGDGIFDPGYYLLIVDQDTVAVGGNFFSSDPTDLNCAPGESCLTATPVQEGAHMTTYDDHWYIFTPDSVGTYIISTCDSSNLCDTKIWIYDSCDGNGYSEDNTGTIFFDDDKSECAPLAMVSAYMGPGQTYYIRIGDNMDACPDSTGIAWEITYQGPVTGCTDPASCNYNPLATVDDGSCLQQGDPNCPEGPDLIVRQDVLETSIYLTTINANDGCLIEEGCLQGYGLRDIIRFSTRIDNIGEKDYFIGQPSNDNTQFTWDNCHNHFHYDGYAEYVLYDEGGTIYPIGFKNGFCVLDLGCTTGTAQYGCGYMGISAGCYDEYWSALECQWIDVTDVPDGRYVFVTRVNWDNAPDALGQVEKDSINNWAQVCILLDRSSGSLEFSLDNDCEPYVDCEGTLYGSAQPDCEGDCNGTRLMGDLDVNGIQEMFDAESYVSGIIGQNLATTPCNDLNADDTLSVYDAALLASCLNYGATHNHEGSGLHDHCSFPDGVYNPNDTVSLSIIDANFEENYIDIGMLNPLDEVNAYQFQVSGIQIMNIESLVDPAVYPIAPVANLSDGTVIGISYQDSLISRSQEYQPLCRLFFQEALDTFICIDNIVDIVNQDYEQVVTKIDDGCVMVLVDGVDQITNNIKVQVMPNPFSSITRLVFGNPNHRPHQISITDVNGKLITTYTDVTDNEIEIDGSDLPSGVYFYQITGDRGTTVGKLSLQR
jgi:hypothetical protein